ncbi:MAG: gas vesicle protein GvpO [Candidatus Methylomirabilales bacterium]
MKIEEVRKAVMDFVQGTLGKEGAIVKISKTHESWEAEVEVIEESQYIKALKIPTKVLDRNIYEVRLNEQLEVVSYERIEQHVIKKSA